MSSRAASPTSPAWVGRGARDNSLVIYDALARAMAFYGDRLTVITLNYDCLLEYSCYCLGIPFTYHRGFDEGGVEILKLHGSINWVRCPDRRCAWRDHTWVPPLEHVPAGAETEAGHVQPKRLECPECGLDLVPVIVPPTWAKEIDDEFIRASWSRAIDVLGQSQALVAAGLSLPNSDSHMRHLLHLGLASWKLIQALVVVGSDAEAAARWSRLFRESWREARLEIRQTSFSEAMHPAILPALGVPRDVLPDSGGTAAFLPIPLGEVVPEKRLEPLMEALKAQGHSEAEALSVTTSVECGSVLEGMRKGEETTHESVRGYRRAIADAGLAWVPSGEALPVSGGFLNWP